MIWPFSLFIERVPPTPAEEAIEQVRRLLFPDLLLRIDEKGRKFHVDYCMDTNLQAVLSDLQTGYNDAATQKTIQQLVDRISKLRVLVGARYELSPEAKYFVVDSDLFGEDPVEERVEPVEEVDDLR
jgi:hypothetical protein